jgi:hypothetical protein
MTQGWLNTYGYFASQGACEAYCVSSCNTQYSTSSCGVLFTIVSVPGVNGPGPSMCGAGYADPVNNCWGVGAAGGLPAAEAIAAKSCSSANGTCPGCCPSCSLQFSRCIGGSPTPASATATATASAFPVGPCGTEACCQLEMAACLRATVPGDLQAECACFGGLDSCLRAVPVGCQPAPPRCTGVPVLGCVVCIWVYLFSAVRACVRTGAVCVCVRSQVSSQELSSNIRACEAQGCTPLQCQPWITGPLEGEVRPSLSRLR